MAQLRCGRARIDLAPGEKVLDGLLRAGIDVAHGCRAGACQACLVQARSGLPPAASQIGLREPLVADGYFLACMAVPDQDLEVEVGGARLERAARIERVDWLSADVLRVAIQPQGPFPHRPGQFVNLVRPDGLVRSYSIASLPDATDGLELHVRRLPGGRMSGWLTQPEAVGASVALRGPAGTCCYTPGDPGRALLLAGTGTGLAPLLGIVRDALQQGHTGAITLYHGGRTAAGLYLVDHLRGLSAVHPNLVYRPCVLEGPAPPEVRHGRLDDLVCQDFPSPAGLRSYLCGDPDLVLGLRRRLFLAGANLRDLFADAFLLAPSPAGSPARS
jgi:NAD(P)H-flavin reductase/ferredoxin